MVAEEEVVGCFPIYDKLGKKTKEILIKNGEKKVFAKGERLPLEYEGSLIWIRKGTAYVFLVGENGGEIYLHKLQKDDCILIKGAKEYEFTTSSEIITLEGKYVDAFLASGTLAENYVLKSQNRVQENILTQLNSVMFTSVDMRLVNFLLKFSSRHSHAVACTHEQIARFIGTSREVVTRKLNTYEEEGIIEMGRGKILIKNRDALRKIK